MPILKNDDINLMIKMENLIGDNQRKLFNRKGEYKYKFRDFATGEMETETVTRDDFNDYMNLIEKFLYEKRKSAEKAKAYYRANPEKRRR